MNPLRTFAMDQQGDCLFQEATLRICGQGDQSIQKPIPKTSGKQHAQELVDGSECGRVRKVGGRAAQVRVFRNLC